MCREAYGLAAPAAFVLSLRARAAVAASLGTIGVLGTSNRLYNAFALVPSPTAARHYFVLIVFATQNVGKQGPAEPCVLRMPGWK